MPDTASFSFNDPLMNQLDCFPTPDDGVHAAPLFNNNNNNNESAPASAGVWNGNFDLKAVPEDGAQPGVSFINNYNNDFVAPSDGVCDENYFSGPLLDYFRDMANDGNLPPKGNSILFFLCLFSCNK